MPQQLNIDLNVDHVGPRDAGVDAARLVVVHACGFTRDGGTPTITEDCTTYGALEIEGQRLKAEIDDAIERARTRFEGKKANKPTPEMATKRGTHRPPSAKPHIDTGLKVRDAMTRDVRTVNRNDRLSVADELMKLGGFRHVVALDDAGAVAGIVSSHDIFHGALAWSLGLGQAAHEKSLASYPVKQVMTTDVVTIAADAELREAAALMSQKKIGCIPVVDGRELVGIITEADFLAILTNSEA